MDRIRTMSRRTMWNKNREREKRGWCVLKYKDTKEEERKNINEDTKSEIKTFQFSFLLSFKFSAFWIAYQKMLDVQLLPVCQRLRFLLDFLLSSFASTLFTFSACSVFLAFQCFIICYSQTVARRPMLQRISGLVWDFLYQKLCNF